MSKQMLMRKRFPGLALLGFVASVLLLASLSAALHPSAPTPRSRPFNPIQQENQDQGAYDWGITKGSHRGEIQGYTSADSLTPGQTLRVYVSTIAPSFTIEVFRLGYYQGLGARLMLTEQNVPGMSQGYYLDAGASGTGPINCPRCSFDPATHEVQANWVANSHLDTLTFASNWVSGLYFIRLTENTTHTQWGIPVVLRDDTAQADAIMTVPFNTYQAYNYWGGTSLYVDYSATPLAVKHAYVVSYNRPYGDNYGAQYLFTWTYQMVKFMEGEGIDVRYTTDNALDKGFTNLANYKAFVVAGHSEYWSYPMRLALQNAIAQTKLSVGFFSGNSMYWQVRMPDDRTVVCYKDELPSIDNDPYDQVGNPNQYLTTTLWRWSPLNTPEDAILHEMYGLESLNGHGYGSSGTVSDLVVTNTSSWAFSNTGLANGDTIPNASGYEVDVLQPGQTWGPNDSVTVLAQSPYVDGNGNPWTQATTLDDIKANGALTHQFIFDAGTIGWPPVMLESSSAGIALRQITWNLLYGMINRTTQIPPIPIRDITNNVPFQTTVSPVS